MGHRIGRETCRLFAFLLGLLLLPAAGAAATMVFESATLGPSYTNHLLQPVLDVQAIGVRFQVTQPILVNSIGGHLLRRSAQDSSSVPASIVALSGPTDYPNSTNRTSSDFLVTKFLEAPFPSGDCWAQFPTMTLQPGWYALVYGRFSDFGSNAVAIKNTDPPTGSYTYFGGYQGYTWYETFPDTMRFFISIPEPTACWALLIAAIPLGRSRRTLS